MILLRDEVFWSNGIKGTINSIKVDWDTDVATTRKSVATKLRKPGLLISYNHPTDGWITEQFRGTVLTDNYWILNQSWNRIVDDSVTDLFIYKNSYINTSGVLRTASGYSATDYLPVLPGDINVGAISLYSTKIPFVFFYDADLKLISYELTEEENTNNNIYKEYKLTIPENAKWFRVNGLKSKGTPYVRYSNHDVNNIITIYNILRDFIVSKDNEIETQISDAKSELTNSFEQLKGKIEFVNDGYTTNQNKFTASSSYGTTDFLPVMKGVQVKVGAVSFKRYNIPWVIYFDKGKNVIGYEMTDSDANNVYQEFTLTIPQNAAYIKVNCLRSQKNSFIEYIGAPFSSLYSLFEYFSSSQPDTTELTEFYPLKGKKVVMLGDSVTEFKNSADGMRIADYFTEMSKATVYSCGIGGACISYRTDLTGVSEITDSTQAYAALDVCGVVDALVSQDFTLISKAVEYLKTNVSDDNTPVLEDIKKVPMNEVDIVTIFAGTNNFNYSYGTSGLEDTDELTNIRNIQGGINYIINRLCTAYPNIQIFIFTPTVRYINIQQDGADKVATFSDDVADKKGQKFEEICTAILSAAKRNHIPACDIYNTMGWNRYNFKNFCVGDDGVHPYKGFKNLAAKFYNFIVANNDLYK